MRIFSPLQHWLPGTLVLSLASALPTRSLAEDPLAQVEALETKHYSLLLAGDAALREDYGALIEAAWNAFQRELKIKPKQKRGEKTTLRLYPDRDDWEAGMTHEQVFALPGVHFVHYEPKLETIYVYGDPQEYHTRKMLLYGLFRQYHLRCKSKNQGLTREWFITGMADALSTHSWNGTDLKLAAQRKLATQNRASLAVAREALAKVADGELSIDDLSDWDVRWALTSFLMYGEGGEFRKTFQKFALGGRGSMLLGHDFLSNLGDPADITARLHVWLRAEARSLQPILGAWDERDGVLFARDAEDEEFAIALADESHVRLQALPGPEREVPRGLVLDWHGPEDCKLALQHEGVLRVVHLTADGLEELEVFDVGATGKGRATLSVRIDGDLAHLSSGEALLGSYPSLGRRIGLVAQAGRASFELVESE